MTSTKLPALGGSRERQMSWLMQSGVPVSVADSYIAVSGPVHRSTQTDHAGSPYLGGRPPCGRAVQDANLNITCSQYDAAGRLIESIDAQNCATDH